MVQDNDIPNAEAISVVFGCNSTRLSENEQSGELFELIVEENERYSRACQFHVAVSEVGKITPGYGYWVGYQTPVDVLLYCIHVHGHDLGPIKGVTKGWEVSILVEMSTTDHSIQPLYSTQMVAHSGEVRVESGIQIPMSLALNHSQVIVILGVRGHGHALAHKPDHELVWFTISNKTVQIADLKFEGVSGTYRQINGTRIQVHPGDTLSAECFYTKTGEDSR